ncbi:hypothetical protein SAMN02745857_03809 [Andreprevotia lacus DSM 23236]|jgi:hypothetical protein|uniref:Copper resistance protein n=1 Tax=Andreprevotia lacus DSM 23236 TaxID=1121001 RepID=A0A1W1XZQ4_9NEIS|nr:hypothetical protein [Andreprevotia lacus]SMC29393.1 hypothetical protein SAMN02745857_03809 [Andreprevotia lacus DSM 23236]
MLRRWKSPFSTWLTICLLVFSQLVVSAYACAEAFPVEQPMAAMSAMSMGDMTECSDMQQAKQPVVCKAHCQKDAQSADIQLPTVPVPLLVFFFSTWSFDRADIPSAGRPKSPPTLVASAPPLRIQYQVFRT